MFLVGDFDRLDSEENAIIADAKLADTFKPLSLEHFDKGEAVRIIRVQKFAQMPKNTSFLSGR